MRLWAWPWTLRGAGVPQPACLLSPSQPLCPQSGAAPCLATDSGARSQRAHSHLPDCSPSSQLLFLTGLSLIIGLRRTFSFFFQRHKFKGTSFFLGGVVIVLLRWPLLGMCLETYGFFSLFR